MQVVLASEEDFEDGIGRGATPVPKLDALTVFQCIYIDNGAIPFNSREQLALRWNVIYDLFAVFG